MMVCGWMDKFPLASLIILSAVCISHPQQPQQQQQGQQQQQPKPYLNYAVKEEVNIGSHIADIVNDAGLNRHGPAVLKILRFKFLNQPPAVVGVLAIDERSGFVSVAGRLDRDAICSQTDEACQMRLDIVVQPMTYFEIIKLAIDVLDINDNAPRFEPDKKVHELLESSLLGTTIVLPTAIDADTARFSVKNYHLQAEALKNDGSGYYFDLRFQKKLDGSTDLKLVLINYSRPRDQGHALVESDRHRRGRSPEIRLHRRPHPCPGRERQQPRVRHGHNTKRPCRRTVPR